MSTGYAVRIRAPFTVEMLRAGTERVLEEMVPSVSLRTVVVLETLADFMGAGAQAPRAGQQFRARVLGDSAPLLPDGVLMTPDADAAVGLTDIDVGYPEEPDGGRSLDTDLTLDRSAASHLLGIAVAVAAARLTGSPVVDERGALTGTRLADPEDIVAALRHVGPPVGHVRDVATSSSDRSASLVRHNLSLRSRPLRPRARRLGALTDVQRSRIPGDQPGTAQRSSPGRGSAGQGRRVSRALGKLPNHHGVAFRGTRLTPEQLARHEPGRPSARSIHRHDRRPVVDVPREREVRHSIRNWSGLATYLEFPRQAEGPFDRNTTFRVVNRIVDDATGKVTS